jgi:hypothetical protein
MEKTAAERGFLKIELIELELDGPYFLDPFRLISSLRNDNTIGGYLDAIGQELEIIFNESAPEVEKRAANGTISVHSNFLNRYKLPASSTWSTSCSSRSVAD